MLIQQYAAEGRIIRDKWSDTDEQGRQLLCLYTALAGDPDARPESCPAHLCPRWLAYVLPWMDDSGTEEAWPSVVSRVAALAPRLGGLSGERGDRLRSRWLMTVLDEALSHAPEGQHVKAVQRVQALLERHGSGGSVSRDEWEAGWVGAWEAAWEAAWAAAWAAARAARTAARAAAGDAARAAARDAADGAWDAADRITDSLLTLIEEELADG